MNDWREMDEALRDGTKILGKYDDGEYLVFWSDDRT